MENQNEEAHEEAQVSSIRHAIENQAENGLSVFYQFQPRQTHGSRAQRRRLIQGRTVSALQMARDDREAHMRELMRKRNEAAKIIQKAFKNYIKQKS